MSLQSKKVVTSKNVPSTKKKEAVYEKKNSHFHDNKNTFLSPLEIEHETQQHEKSMCIAPIDIDNTSVSGNRTKSESRIKKKKEVPKMI